MKKTRLIRITTNKNRDQQDQGNERRLYNFEHGGSFQISWPRLSSVNLDRGVARLNPEMIDSELPWSTSALENAIPKTDVPTMIIPTMQEDSIAVPHEKLQDADDQGVEEQVALLGKLAKNSGIYALSSIAVPLVSLVLAPFLTHHLTLYDYGALVLTNTAISLAVGVTQLGLSSAFFRAYGYDYTAERDRRDVVATVTTLLCLVSIPMTIMVSILSPWLAELFFGNSSLGNYIAIAGGVVLLQNLTIPGMAWLRAENRPLLYSLLSISNLLVTLLATIYLIGVLNWGVPGAIIANGLGYAFIVICTLPVIVVLTGVKLRSDIIKNLLAFGLPLVLNFFSYWVLQLMDRYLLSLFASLAETAMYSVAYTLGSVMSVVIIGPFTLAWPTAMFALAKRKNAVKLFKLLFRWLSMLLLFAAFGFTFVATFILDWLFPTTYHSAAFVIPIVAESLVFYGLYFVFMVGANIRRKTWLTAVFTTIAALVNVALNLFLIPHAGSMGAAVATLIAYIILALAAYIANQRLYPIPFEIGRFTVGLLVGVGLYMGSIFLAKSHGTYVAWGYSLVALVFYGGFLALLARPPVLVRSVNVINERGVTRSSYENSSLQ